MSKTLYVSDLDGTLLNSHAMLSDYTVSRINELIEQGMYFTFATARTIYSAAGITERLNINVPCILNNGASIYDISRGEYVRNACIQLQTSRQIVNLFRNRNVSCFVFKFIDGKLTTCFDSLDAEQMTEYTQERRKIGQPFVECENVADILDGSEIYINSIGEYDDLLPVRNAVLNMDGAGCVFYRDTYTRKWYLEIFSKQTSKGKALSYLREAYGFDRIVAFGDNLNDLTMFEAADLKFAVRNANVDLKLKADMVIDSNKESGVANFLVNNFERIEAGLEPEMPFEDDEDDD